MLMADEVYQQVCVCVCVCVKHVLRIYTYTYILHVYKHYKYEVCWQNIYCDKPLVSLCVYTIYMRVCVCMA